MNFALASDKYITLKTHFLHDLALEKWVGKFYSTSCNKSQLER